MMINLYKKKVVKLVTKPSSMATSGWPDGLPGNIYESWLPIGSQVKSNQNVESIVSYPRKLQHT